MDASVTLQAAPLDDLSDNAAALLMPEAPHLPDVPGVASESTEPDAWLPLLLDELAHGVIVIDRQGQVQHANQAARRVLACAEVLRIDAGQLDWVRPEDALTFQQAIGRALTGRRQLIRLLATARDSAFSLALLPLRHPSGRPPEHLALLFSRTGVSDSGLFAAFSRSHQLTRTEEQVLIHLCGSLGAPEIARQMNVAVSTVCSHVRSLCAKTASSGVRELVNRLAVLPPVAPEVPVPMH
jgi:DNA-binding CsgD family transcriptional regulator